MIVKYKLKQLYPGSPYKIKVGDIVSTTAHCTGRDCGKRNIIGFNKTMEFEKYPNIWKRLKNKK